jgi:predicted DNA-binding transcriptional regulator AlpA
MDENRDTEALELLDADDVGQILKRSRSGVLVLWRTGQLSGVRLGYRGVRFTRSDVAEYIRRHRVEAR